jgi:ribosomal-protein-serine acetyltransferase
MPITNTRFTWPIGDGIVLIPRTPEIAVPYHALLAANHARLAVWSPGIKEPTLEATRTALEGSGMPGSPVLAFHSPSAIAPTTVIAWSEH